MSILLWRVYVENWGYVYCMSLGIMGFRGARRKILQRDAGGCFDNVIIGNLFCTF